jgi:hypothetical protein
MRTVFVGETDNGKVLQDDLYFRDGLSETMIKGIFESWKQQNEFNYGVRFKDAKYVCLA